MQVNFQVMQQLFEIFFNLQIQKRIAVATIICGNTISRKYATKFHILTITVQRAISNVPGPFSKVTKQAHQSCPIYTRLNQCKPVSHQLLGSGRGCDLHRKMRRNISLKHNGSSIRQFLSFLDFSLKLLCRYFDCEKSDFFLAKNFLEVQNFSIKYLLNSQLHMYQGEGKIAGSNPVQFISFFSLQYDGYCFVLKII